MAEESGCGVITVQFPAIFIRFKGKAMLVWCEDAGQVWLPVSQVERYQPMADPGPSHFLWVTVTTWIANKKRIRDKREELGV